MVEGQGRRGQILHGARKSCSSFDGTKAIYRIMAGRFLRFTYRFRADAHLWLMALVGGPRAPSGSTRGQGPTRQAGQGRSRRALIPRTAAGRRNRPIGIGARGRAYDALKKYARDLNRQWRATAKKLDPVGDRTATRKSVAPSRC